MNKIELLKEIERVQSIIDKQIVQIKSAKTNEKEKATAQKIKDKAQEKINSLNLELKALEENEKIEKSKPKPEPKPEPKKKKVAVKKEIKDKISKPAKKKEYKSKSELNKMTDAEIRKLIKGRKDELNLPKNWSIRVKRRDALISLYLQEITFDDYTNKRDKLPDVKYTHIGNSDEETLKKAEKLLDAEDMKLNKKDKPKLKRKARTDSKLNNENISAIIKRKTKDLPETQRISVKEDELESIVKEAIDVAIDSYFKAKEGKDEKNDENKVYKAQFLKINYNDKKAQKTAKLNGFVWNDNLKLWEHKSKKEVELRGLLVEYITTKNVGNNKMSYGEAYAKYGLDFAEEGEY